MNKITERETSIDFCKVLGIFLIVISHIVQTLCSNPLMTNMVDLSHSTYDITKLVLVFLRHSGVLGNNLFFLCSVWFFVDSISWNRKKEWNIIVEVWIISVLFLIGSLFVSYKFGIGEISNKDIIKSLFPTLFSNNWYLTTYLMFYPIHPFLNQIIEKTNQKEHLLVSLTLFVFTFGFGCVGVGPFGSSLIIWITIYFLLSYLKKYMGRLLNDFKTNTVILILSVVIHMGVVLLTDYFGHSISFFNDKLIFWNRNQNPFLFGISLSIFNLIRNMKLKSNRIISHISMLSLYIYITHENILFRKYYRQLLWNYVYENFGYNYIILWVFVLSFIVFLFGYLCSVLYKLIFQKTVKKIVDKTFSYLCCLYNWIGNLLVKVK